MATPPSSAPPVGVATPLTTSPTPTPTPSASATPIPPPPGSAPPPAKLPPLIPYTGIPRLSLPKKLPHRNWFIFAAVVTIPTYLWYDDREQAKAIKADYIARVAHLANVPLEGGALGRVRTATVYASRWPGEEDGKAAAWWKRYVKPYLVASAIDYTLPDLPNYASLTELVAKQYHDLRASSDDAPRAMHTLLSPEEKRAQDVEGGIMLIGRQSLKEYMEGLRRGWKEDRRDDQKWIAELDQSMFDDPAPEPKVEAAATAPAPDAGAVDAEGAPVRPKVNLFPLTNPGLNHSPPTSLYTPPALPTPSSLAPPLPPAPAPLPALPPTPSTLPAHPPVLMIPYHPDLGFSSVPRSIWGWFNTRKDTLLGAQAAMSFILSQPDATFASPRNLQKQQGGESGKGVVGEEGGWIPSREEQQLQFGDAVQGGDLDWDAETAEKRCYRKDFEKLPTQVEERMRAYYTALGPRVAKAWEIKKGRPFTDAEMKHTPLTLEELQAERIKRERRARQDLDGYQILRKGSGVAWAREFEGKWGKWEWEGKDAPEGGKSEFA